jgi:hypothetical protein
VVELVAVVVAVSVDAITVFSPAVVPTAVAWMLGHLAILPAVSTAPPRPHPLATGMADSHCVLALAVHRPLRSTTAPIHSRQLIKRLGGTDLLRLLLFLLLASRRFVFLDFPFFFVSQSMFAITLILLWGLWRENQRLLCVWKTRAYLLTPLGGGFMGLVLLLL